MSDHPRGVVAVSFVLNDARFDSRVARVAGSLGRAGFRSIVVARTIDPYAAGPDREAGDGVELIRVPVASGWLRLVLLARRPGALPGALLGELRSGPAGVLRAVAAAVVGLVALPVVAVGLGARALAGSSRAVRSGWLAVSWQLQWRLGVMPWAREAAAMAARELAGETGGVVLYAHDVRALPAALATRDAIGHGAVIYDSHEIFSEAGEHAERPGFARAWIRERERRLASRADALVTVNRALAEWLGPRLGFQDVTVVHNAATPRGDDEADASPLRAAAGVPADADLILYHGGLAPGRGIETLVAALREPGLERAHLVFMGSGPSRGAVEAMSVDPANGGRVHLLPPVPPADLVRWVAGADVVAAPIQSTTLNHRLSTPNKVFEGLAAGVPVVASDLPQLREILLGPDGPLGAVADPDDPAAFGRAIRQVLGGRRKDRDALRRRVLAAARDRWSWEREVQPLVQLVERLAAGDAEQTVAVGEAPGAMSLVRPGRLTIVLPTSGEFDSRTRRLATSMAARGHDVTIVARPAVGGASARETPDAGTAAGPIRWLRVGPAARPPSAGLAPATADRRGRGAARWLRDLPRAARIARGAWQYRSAARAAAPETDLVHAMGLLALPAATAIASRRQARLVYDARDLYVESNNLARYPAPVKGAVAWLERRWARSAARVITVNDALADELQRRLGVARPAVVLNGQPAADVVTDPDRRLAETAGVPEGAPIVLYHGGFMPDRGLTQLVDAIADDRVASAHLVLMGSGVMADSLQAHIIEAKLGDRVHLLPPVPPSELLRWVAGADVGVMVNQPATLNERLSTPNKLFECLAAGVPIVSSDLPARRRLIMDPAVGPLGTLCDPTRPAAIAEAIAGLLAMPEDERAALRERCRDAARGPYAWEGQMETVVRAYADATGRAW